MDWACVALGGWDSAILNEFGVKAVPSLWLIDPEGRIVLTGQQTLIELAPRLDLKPNRDRAVIGQCHLHVGAKLARCDRDATVVDVTTELLI